MLDWSVPEGSWTILRFGCTPTSSHVSTSSGDWQGSVLDYMSEAVIRSYWDRHVRPLVGLVRPLCGTALKYVETDSWECGGMNWSPGFENDFEAYLGYDPLPWLPVLAGKIVDDRQSSNASSPTSARPSPTALPRTTTGSSGNLLPSPI